MVKKIRKGGKRKKDKDDEDKKVDVEIDFDGLNERIVEIPVASGNYHGLMAAKNMIFYLSRENRGMMGGRRDEDGPRGMKLHRYNVKKEKHKVIFNGVRAYDLSGDGEKLVVWQKGQFIVRGVNEGPGGDFGGFGGKEKKDDEDNNGNVDLSQWDLRVEVRAEWQQMFREAWRLQRDFFWTPDMHQVDWQGGL